MGTPGPILMTVGLVGVSEEQGLVTPITARSWLEAQGYKGRAERWILSPCTLKPEMTASFLHNSLQRPVGVMTCLVPTEGGILPNICNLR